MNHTETRWHKLVSALGKKLDAWALEYDNPPVPRYSQHRGR